MKNFKAFTLAALTALTVLAPTAEAKAPMERCEAIYRQAPHETECVVPYGVQHIQYTTVGQYVAELGNERPTPPVAAATNNTADFMSTLMNGLNGISTGVSGITLEGLANTNTSNLDDECAGGTLVSGNDLYCRDNNGNLTYRGPGGIDTRGLTHTQHSSY